MGLQLTKNFNENEFFVSSKYPQLAMKAKYLRNTSRDYCFFLMCYLILQPSRDFINKAIFISSGYRDWILNVKVGGSKNSLHLKSMAVDITTEEPKDLFKIYEFIKTKLSGRFSQLIIYVYPNGEPRNIHIALPCLGRTLIIKEKTVERESK